MGTIGPSLDRAVFTTGRLRLRPMTMEDAKAMYHIKSDPLVTEGYGLNPHQRPEETAAWVERCVADRGQGTALTWAIELKEKGCVIGECCLWNIDQGSHRAELGYELHHAQWGKGLMVEALSPVLNFAFADMELHRVEAFPLATNRPSISILQKLSFVYEGTYRQRVLVNQGYVDQLIFALLEGD
ncbi:MAG: GNAT family N-acetyltransferase [Methanomassiliicoccales archaeon]|nr:GNAT family N-acetyltransferase [Methanomassiliicoccales archaeon]